MCFDKNGLILWHKVSIYYKTNDKVKFLLFMCKKDKKLNFLTLCVCACFALNLV